MNLHRFGRAVAVGGLGAGLLAGVLGPSAAVGAAPAGCSAPQRDRVDLGKPTFPDPTSITNPLFPRGSSGQSIELGVEAGEKLRFEVTYLPDTLVVQWDGINIETRVTHFVAYKEGRILETALDYYAQDAAGNVWYFGEDVSNYENGVVVDNEGTWLAGRDGPPGMIMPAKPEVGDVYRPENIPGFVFEEVTVKATGKTVEGPSGKVPGAVFIQECLMDGTLEDKRFAPGYGEFHAKVAAHDEVYGLALAVPIDSLRGRAPVELRQLVEQARTVFRAVPNGNWEQLSDRVDAMDKTWDRYSRGSVPPRLYRQMTSALVALTKAVDKRDAGAARQASIDVGQAGLDLLLRHEPQAGIDRARLGLWDDQLALDRAAGDAGAVAGDRATIRAIAERIRN
ncbi:MAG: hypothetical protein ACR2HV_02255 [Acidimicrobiales bacterium]